MTMLMSMSALLLMSMLIFKAIINITFTYKYIRTIQCIFVNI